MVWLRWLGVLISPVAITAVVLVAAWVAMTVTNSRCDEINLAAGLCVEPWHTTALDVIAYLSVVILVLGFVVLPSLIAPRFKRAIAIIGFVLVSTVPVVAYSNSGWSDLLSVLVVALVYGGMAIAWVWWRAGRNSHGT
jgi:hypothetical protein|tara:strand:- start:1258 stop:1671 length:414 start_codon:yes stop_codon:yes gene_type:complete